MASNRTKTVEVQGGEGRPDDTSGKTPIVGRVKQILLTFAACTLIAAALSRAASTTKKRRNSSMSHLLQDCVHSLKSLIPTMNSVMAYLHEDDEGPVSGQINERVTADEDNYIGSSDGGRRGSRATKRARTSAQEERSSRGRTSERSTSVRSDCAQPQSSTPNSLVGPSSPDLHTKSSQIEFPSPALGQISTGQYCVRMGDDVELCIEADSTPTRAVVTDASGSGLCGSTVTVVDTGEDIKLSSEHTAKILMDGTNYGSLRLQQHLGSIVRNTGQAAEVNTSVGDMVVLAGESATDADHEMWLGIATKIAESKVHVKYLRQIIKKSFDPFVELNPGQEMWFVFYEPKAFTKNWREAEVPVESILFSDSASKYLRDIKVAAGIDTIDAFKWVFQ